MTAMRSTMYDVVKEVAINSCHEKNKYKESSDVITSLKDR